MPVTLELDDLKQVWQSLDRRLERQYALDLQRFRDARLRRARGPFYLLTVGQIVQLIGGGAATALFARFAWHHLDQAHLALAGALLATYAAMCWAYAVRDLVLIGRIDFSAPVLRIQRRLAELRVWHGHTSVGFVVAGCLMWVPLTQLAFYAIGADLWILAPQVIAGFWASAAVCLLIAWVLVRLSRRPGYEGLARFVERTVLGYSLTQMQAAVAEVEKFERED